MTDRYLFYDDIKQREAETPNNWEAGINDCFTFFTDFIKMVATENFLLINSLINQNTVKMHYPITQSPSWYIQMYCSVQTNSPKPTSFQLIILKDKGNQQKFTFEIRECLVFFA